MRTTVGDAVPFGHVVGAGGVHHERDAGLLAHLRDRRAFVAAQRADQEVHLLLQREAARLRERLVGVAGGVGGDDLDLASAGGVLRLLPEEREAVLHVLAGRGERAGERRQQADADRAGLRCAAGAAPSAARAAIAASERNEDGSHGRSSFGCRRGSRGRRRERCCLDMCAHYSYRARRAVNRGARDATRQFHPTREDDGRRDSAIRERARRAAQRGRAARHRARALHRRSRRRRAPRTRRSCASPSATASSDRSTSRPRRRCRASSRSSPAPSSSATGSARSRRRCCSPAAAVRRCSARRCRCSRRRASATSASRSRSSSPKRRRRRRTRRRRWRSNSTSCPRWRTSSALPPPARRRSGTVRPATSVSTGRTATRRRSTPRSRRPRTWRACGSSTPASRSRRWSRAPRSARGTPRPAATR